MFVQEMRQSYKSLVYVSLHHCLWHLISETHDLQANAIRVYNVDPALDHSACASIFNAAGIYMIIDVNSPLSGESLNRAEPWTSYNKDYLTRIFGVVENFKGCKCYGDIRDEKTLLTP